MTFEYLTLHRRVFEMSGKSLLLAESVIQRERATDVASVMDGITSEANNHHEEGALQSE